MVQVVGDVQPKKTVHVHKVELDNGKQVYLREPAMADIRQAIRMSGNNDSNNMAISWGMSEELVKTLICKIDDHTLTSLDRNSLDKHLTVKQQLYLMGYVVKYMTGMGEDEGKLVRGEVTTIEV